MTPQARWIAKDRAEKRRLGLVRRDVWAHPDDWEYIREVETRLREEREDTEKRPSERGR